MKRLIGILLAITLPLLPAAAHPGVGIVENSKGEIFYTDLKQVWKITTSGRIELAVPNVHSHELFIDPQDNLYGEHLWYNGEQKDTWGHYVWKRSADGHVSKEIPNTEGFLKNYSFARDHLGRMYWAEGSTACQKIVRRNKDNTQTTLEGPCYHNVRFIHGLRDGGIAVVDFQDIKKINARGTVTTVAPKIANKQLTTSNADNQHSVMGVWDDARGSLYSAVASERVVKRFKPDGSEEDVFRTSFPWSPSGGLVDSRGRLWVLEFNPQNAVRVERVETNGQSTVFEP